MATARRAGLLEPARRAQSRDHLRPSLPRGRRQRFGLLRFVGRRPSDMPRRGNGPGPVAVRDRGPDPPGTCPGGRPGARGLRRRLRTLRAGLGRAAALAPARRAGGPPDPRQRPHGVLLARARGAGGPRRPGDLWSRALPTGRRVSGVPLDRDGGADLASGCGADAHRGIPTGLGAFHLRPHGPDSASGVRRLRWPAHSGDEGTRWCLRTAGGRCARVRSRQSRDSVGRVFGSGARSHGSLPWLPPGRLG